MSSITVYLSGLTVEVLDKPIDPPQTGQSFFSDDFASGNLSHSENGAHWTDQANTRVIASPNGTPALEFKFLAAPADAWAEQRFSLGGSYPDLWMSYDLYIPLNYVHRSPGNNKGFSYFWSGDYGALTGPLLATNFWPDGNNGSRASQWMRTPTFTEGRHLWPDDPVWINSQVINASDLGKWMHVVVHAKYASAANNDGVYEVWKNGQKLIGITNGNWYVPGATGFDQGYLLGWANSGFVQETKLYIDNIKFSVNPLS